MISAFRTYALCLCCLLITPVVIAQQMLKNLTHLFDSLQQRDGFNGCVLVAEDGKPIFDKAIGYADLDKKQLLNTQTAFELASVSKQFTAMAIMQLKEQGKLSYEDPVKKYLPELTYPGITIRHLLVHTSGLPDFLGFGEKELDVTRINYNKDVLAALVAHVDTLLFTPGTEQGYCNTNYLLLALVVEKISGMSFADYMTASIFKPLGMQRTRVYARRAKTMMDNYALSYMWNAGENRFVEPDSVSKPSRAYYLDGAAGPYGISSTVEDLLKWDQALYTNKLVQATTLREAFTPAKMNDGKAGKLFGLGYGFGWLIAPNDDTAIGGRVFHSGGYPGYQSMITRYIDKHKTVILLTNFYDKQSVYELSGAIEKILFGYPYAIPEAKVLPRSVAVTAEQIKGFDGAYAMDIMPSVIMTITTRNNRVYAQLTGQGEYEVYASAPDTFFYTVVAARLKFEKGKDGIVHKITLFQNGQEMPMSRVKASSTKL
jgi:CubicO group peptidase (beta-lactamase class C family)